MWGMDVEEEHQSKRPIYKRIYEDHYKKLLIIPFLLLFLAFVQIGVQWSTTGDFVHKGVELKGGITQRIIIDYDAQDLENFLKQELNTDVS